MSTNVLFFVILLKYSHFSVLLLWRLSLLYSFTLRLRMCVSVAHGTRDIIFNVHVLDFVWVWCRLSFFFLSLHVRTFLSESSRFFPFQQRKTTASITMTFLRFPVFSFSVHKNSLFISMVFWRWFSGLYVYFTHGSCFSRDSFSIRPSKKGTYVVPTKKSYVRQPKTNCMQNTIEYTSKWLFILTFASNAKIKFFCVIRR